MLGKRPHKMIGRLSELLVSGYHAGFLDVATGPKSPLDYKIQSPRGLKSYDLGGVGLGIVAALEKSCSDGNSKYAIYSPNLNRSEPIPVNSGKTHQRFMSGLEDSETESLENYTYVTSHGPNKSCTRVYYSGGEYSKHGHDRSVVNNRCGVNSIPKEVQVPVPVRLDEDVSVYRTSDFLRSCHLCRKKLDGKDIYMYRGEKGFCSAECRSRQIMIDERKEQCRSEVRRSADVSSSPYTTSPIFSTGIVAV